MNKKFTCQLTLNIIENQIPTTNAGWEIFNKILERMIEQTFETNRIISIQSAEVIIEEHD